MEGQEAESAGLRHQPADGSVILAPDEQEFSIFHSDFAIQEFQGGRAVGHMQNGVLVRIEQERYITFSRRA